MAFYDSSVSRFFIDDTGGDSRDLSPYITAMSGLPGPRRLNPATTVNDTGDKWSPGLQGATPRLELLWSDDTDVGPDTVFGPLRVHTAAVDFNYGPEGDTAGDIKYYGTCWIEDFDITSRVGNLVVATVILKVEGVVNKGTFPVV